MRFHDFKFVSGVFACLMVVASPTIVNAGAIGIGPIGIAQYTVGLSFDDIDPLHRPMVADADRSLMRLSLTDASTIQMYLTPDAPAIRGLEYAGNGNYYQIRDQPNRLYTVNPVAGTAVAAPSTFGVNYNFADLARDPATGKLWMLTYDNGGQLLEVDPATGVQTLVKQLGTSLGALTSIAVGPNGRLFVANINVPSGNNQGFIYELDPLTGSMTSVGRSGFSSPDRLVDFAYDTVRNQWFGVEDRRTLPRPEWDLFQITGLPVVPEPTGFGVAGVIIMLQLGKRR